ncbi:MAG: TonB-dependent receptor [Alphaproteobacteria bacterium]|nr:TonB-dependent receptor [Alphaproteobacteria bacterium]
MSRSIKIRMGNHAALGAFKKALLSGGAMSCLAVSAMAHAQEAAPAKPAGTDQVGLADIVVTAQRRSENLQNVPVAVSALDTTALKKVGFEHPGDISAVIPSVQVQEIYGKFQPIFAIRGVSQSSYSANQTSPVGVYADEAYIGETFLHGANFFDIERVEVLKGPQGTLYGKNTTGGAINLISKTPKMDGDPHMNLTVGYGNYKAVNVEGGAEATVVPGKIAVRIAGYYNDDEGYQRNITLNTRMALTHTYGFRATALIKPTNNLTAILRYTHSNTNQIPNMNRAIGALAGPGGSLVDLGGYARPATLGYNDFESNSGAQYLKISYDLVTLSTTLNLPRFDIVSVSSYHTSDKALYADIDGGLSGVSDQGYYNKTKAFSQDLRLVSTGNSRLKFIGGIYYGYERNAQDNTYWLYHTPLNGLVNALAPSLGSATANYIGGFYGQFGQFDARQTLTHKSYAAYTEVRWQVTPRFGATGGIRYTHDNDGQPYYNISRFSGPNGTALGSYIPGNITAGLASPTNAAFDSGLTQYINGPYTSASAPYLSVVNKRVTGKFTLDFKPTDRTMVYASYSRGYRSGNFSAGLTYLFLQPNQGAYARPESVNAYEIGAKTEFFDRRLRFNAAVFQYDYTNQQFEDVQGISTVLLNAGSSRLRGLETDLTVAPAEGLSLSLSGLFLDAKYLQLTLHNTDLSGNQLISAPKLSATAAVDYTAPIGNGFKYALHADASYRSRQWYSAFDDKLGYGNIGQAGYALVNGRISLESDHGYSVALWAKNMLDRKYVSYAINIQSAFGMDYLMDGPPRTYGVELSYKF